MTMSLSASQGRLGESQCSRTGQIDEECVVSRQALAGGVVAVDIRRVNM